MVPYNLHTHTVYCDGKDTPREMIEKAISLGCEKIGFSGHSFTEFDQKWCMSRENTEKYKKEITDLKKEYKGKIEILLGIEQDYFSTEPTDDYDYIIGSVHYVFKDGIYFPIDESADIQIKTVNEHYNGDFMAYCEDYYSLEKDVYNKTKCDIIGHFDLVTKFNEDKNLFDTSDERYIKASDDALRTLLETPAVFEINYGAISRGYRKTPYPDDRILGIIVSNGHKTIKTSDCHDREKLLLGLL